VKLEDLDLGLSILERFDDLVKKLDPNVSVVLAGHLLIEETLNEILDLHLFNSGHLAAARLSFSQKVEICKGLAHKKEANSVWGLISEINKLRNAYAHSLDPSRLERARTAFRDRFRQETDGSSDINASSPLRFPGLPDAGIFKIACYLCLGFLNALKEDSESFRTLAEGFLEANEKLSD
jgi:hypothetical protein